MVEIVQVDVLAGVGLALPVQRQVLAESGFQDHRRQFRPGAATGDRVGRRGWLDDGLAGAADERLAHGLDDLHCRGITSSVLVTLSPSLASLPWQQGQVAATRIDEFSHRT